MLALVPLPVVVPLLAAVVVAGFGRFLRSRLVDLLTIAVAAGVAVISAVLLAQSLRGTLTYWFGGWQPVGGLAVGVAFVVEPFGAALALLAAVVAVVSAVFSFRYFEEVGALAHVLVLVFLAALCGFALTGDLFDLFVFFELMSVTAFALTAYRSDEGAPLQGAMNFTVSNSVAAFLLLFGIGLLYACTGVLNFADLGARLQSAPADVPLVVSFALIACGFFVKAAVVPFHFWLADAYAAAPAPAAVLFSAVMSDLGLYAVAEIWWRVFSGALGRHAGAVSAVLLTLGVLTALVGTVMTLLQRDLKRLFAFATISHVGLFLLGIGLLTPDGLAGALVYLVADGLVKGGLFLAAGVLVLARGSGDELALRGRGRDLPALGAAVALGGLALAALPPFGTFVGKALIEDAAVGAGAGWVPWVLLVVEAVTGGAVLRAAGRIFMGWGAGHDPLLSRRDEDERADEPARVPPRTPWVSTSLVVVLVAGGLALGLAPGLADAATAAAHRFTAEPGPGAATPPSVQAFVLAALSTAAAAGVAALTLGLHRRVPLRWLGVLTRGPVAVLRAAHSGHTGDYVTWIAVGTLAVGAALVLTAVG